MNQALGKMVNIGLRLANREKIGRPEEENYFPRGIVVDELSEKNAAERAIDMLMAKVRGESVVPEIELAKFDRLSPAPPISDLSTAKIALVTDGGLVLKGNPDGFEPRSASRLCILHVPGKEALSEQEFEGHHAGYSTSYVNQDPNRLVPLDAMRILEREGVIGKLHDKIYATAGVAASLENARRIGRLIVEQLRAEGVSGVIQTST
jgi:glycine reductase